MSIDFTCSCGKHLHAPDGTNGKKARCSKCGTIVTIPDLVLDDIPVGDTDLYDTVPAAPPPSPHPPTPARTALGITPRTAAAASPRHARVSAPSIPVLATHYSSSQNSSIRRFAYVLLLLALIPLILSSLLPGEDHTEQLGQALVDHPELLEEYSRGDLSPSQFKAALMATLPGDRLEGALLAQKSHAHWLMALAAAEGWFGFLLLAFQNAARFTKGLLFAALFTGTVGIVLLLVFQFAAAYMPVFIPRGVVGMVLLLIKFIGFSYAMADNPHYGFVLSFIGFTCGVGLCEEICKAIPLLLRIKPTPGEEDPSCQSLLLWGLASGIGFGIAEGIMYSGRYYNGMEGAGIYYVRFLSCVALHAMWAGAVGVSVYRHQGDLLGTDDNWAYFFHVVRIILIPMILHGLYDTLLKKDLEVMALLVALATFAYLAFQIETQRRAEPQAVTA